jgi:hypothetical protein
VLTAGTHTLTAVSTPDDPVAFGLNREHHADGQPPNQADDHTPVLSTSITH